MRNQSSTHLKSWKAVSFKQWKGNHQKMLNLKFFHQNAQIFIDREFYDAKTYIKLLNYLRVKY